MNNYIDEVLNKHLSKKIDYAEYLKLLDNYLKNNISNIDINYFKQLSKKLNKTKKSFLICDIISSYILHYYENNDFDINVLFGLLDELKSINIDGIIIKLLQNNNIRLLLSNINNISYNNKYSKYAELIEKYIMLLNDNIHLDFQNPEYYYTNDISDIKDYSLAYKRRISSIPILTPFEEIYLFKKYNEGDNKAKEILHTRNLRLASSIANKIVYRYSYKSPDDAIQVANETLAEAIDTFDYKIGKKFSQYATYIITQNVKRYILNDRLISVPEDLILGKKKRQNDLINNNAIQALKDIESINRPYSIDNNEDELVDFLSNENGLYSNHLLLEDEVMLKLLIEEAESIIANTILTEQEFRILESVIKGRKVKSVVEEEGISHFGFYVILNRVRNKLLDCPKTKGLIIYTDNPDIIKEKIKEIRYKR